MALPYETATSGKAAIAEMQKILQHFGCASFGVMNDYDKDELIVQFKYRSRDILLKASLRGYAAAWLKEHPWSYQTRRTKIEHACWSQCVDGGYTGKPWSPNQPRQERSHDGPLSEL